MKKTNTFTILGCGSSQGVPRVGLGWGDCDPNEPKNRRLRCSILLETPLSTILVDTGPDLREQLITANVTHLDGVFLTHDHADHCHGIDDLRPLALMHRKRVAVHADVETKTTMLNRFRYCFERAQGSSYPAILDMHEFTGLEPFNINDVTILPLPVQHGDIMANGLRVNNFAYVPDVNDIPPMSEAQLQGLDMLILDCLRYQKHVSHFNLEDALHWIERLKPKHTILTNLHCDLDYNILKKSLPHNIEPAFDGMQGGF
jgi:phosphoribosyl 1,2-cyclic phosphate phosphodiesterase